MLPPKTDPRWRKLVTGEIKHEFELFSAGLMMTRIGRSLSHDSSEPTVQKYVDETHAFFSKYEAVLQNDIKAVFG